MVDDNQLLGQLLARPPRGADDALLERLLAQPIALSALPRLSARRRPGRLLGVAGALLIAGTLALGSAPPALAQQTPPPNPPQYDPNDPFLHLRGTAFDPDVLARGGAAPPAPRQPTRRSQAAPPSRPADTYLIQPGDTLSDIAFRCYGNAELWNVIYRANARVIGPDPNVIPAGVRIVIPAV